MKRIRETVTAALAKGARFEGAIQGTPIRPIGVEITSFDPVSGTIQALVYFPPESRQFKRLFNGTIITDPEQQSGKPILLTGTEGGSGQANDPAFIRDRDVRFNFSTTADGLAGTFYYMFWNGNDSEFTVELKRK